MKPVKTSPKTTNLRKLPKSCTSIDRNDISPKLNVLPKLWSALKKVDYQIRVESFSKSPRERVSASESNLPSKDVVDTVYDLENDISAQGDEKTSSDMQYSSKSNQKCAKVLANSKGHCNNLQTISKDDKNNKCCNKASKKSLEALQSPSDLDTITKQIRDIHTETRKSTRIIRDSRVRLTEIRKKTNLTEADIKELGERNELLLREMERFDRLTKTIQKLLGEEVSQMRKSKNEQNEHSKANAYIPSDIYDSPIYQEMKMDHPTIVLGVRKDKAPDLPTRSKSEIDLTRKLCESYDMQEKLVADNTDLEVKRYILYKELMTKDQNLEICRSQIKRLQGELKLMSNENALLHEKLNKNHPEGDATAMNQSLYDQEEENYNQENGKIPVKDVEGLLSKLKNYQNSTLELEHQLGGLEIEVRNIRVEMADVKAAAASACRGGGGGKNTCFEQPPGGPPVPPMTRACGVCPPCPAPCNPNAPPTPAEREVERLKIQLRQTEESLKTKVTECAMLRTDLLKKKEELEKERCQHREVQNKLRELEMKFEGLTTHTNMLLGTKEQAFEQEVNVRALKQCYREARDEIDELRTLMKEQNNQLQDYRVKYLQAQQLVEEQRRQMDMMDMDNTRISEQINLEIQRVKIKFQEKLQELAPIPDLLKATQMKLKDAQQSQAIAEHKAEQLARELNSAREKVHVLLHNSLKPPEKPPERGTDEKQMALLQQRISQLTETNMALKTEIERLKANVIRMEESVLANEKRLQEKMHECAQLGGELDRARDEAARALQRANERTETVRKCMQTTVGELERQLASTRAQVKTSEKEREELQCRMQCQIKRLNENFEQAQLRILGLQTQVQTLRRTVSSTGDGEGDVDQQECACKTFFDNP
ncbi:paramyosin-like [Melitaea cinxia]|uniref:paramyosin-like n=1 Tax=Melitaea cinxia TaxID=113334 RepID=UPI001E272725|nr:paramyosin-like [Melitaea cinxia]